MYHIAQTPLMPSLFSALSLPPFVVSVPLNGSVSLSFRTQAHMILFSMNHKRKKTYLSF